MSKKEMQEWILKLQEENQNLKDEIEELQYDLEYYKDKVREIEQDIEDNYKPISKSVQYDVYDNMFI